VGSGAIGSLIITAVGLVIGIISLIREAVPLRIRLTVASVAGMVSLVGLVLLIGSLESTPQSKVNAPSSPASTSSAATANTELVCVTFDVSCPASASAQIGAGCQCPDGGTTVSGTVHGSPFGG
jgi:hypothetical protein